MSSGTKSISKSVSLEPALWERIEAKAETKWGGNRSAYLRDLATADLEGKISPQSDSVLSDLTRVFHPTIEKEIVGHHGNQGRIIARFLDALAEAFKRKEFDPEAPFALYNSAEQMAALLAAKPGGPELLRQMRDFAFSHPLAVAEGQSTRSHKPPETKVKDKIKTGPAAPSRADSK